MPRAAATSARRAGDEVDAGVRARRQDRDSASGARSAERAGAPPLPGAVAHLRWPRDPRQVLRHHPARGRPAGGRARRLGDRDDLLAGLPARGRPGRGRRDRRARCGAGSSSPACSSTRRSTRSRDAAERDRAHARPAPRRRGPGVLRRGRPPHRRAGHQGAAASRSRRRHPRARALPHRLPPARRRARRACAAAPARRSTGSWLAQRRSQVPLILAGGLTPENVAAGDRGVAAVRRRRGERRRGRARDQGPRAKVEALLAAAGRRRAGPAPRARGGVERDRASSTASAPTAASTSPRR